MAVAPAPPAPRHAGGATASSEELARWRTLCQHLLAQPSPFTNTVHLATQAQEALLACGMQRIMLLSLDSTDTLRVQQTAGLPKEAAGLALGGAEQTAAKLMSQAGQLRITPQNNNQFAALLPARCAPCSAVSMCCCARWQ